MHSLERMARMVRCCYCIDDSLHLIINPTFVTYEKQTEIVISELQNLGFTINEKKNLLLFPLKELFYLE